eukprot:3045602-Rhodomonas_salina.1
MEAKAETAERLQKDYTSLPDTSHSELPIRIYDTTKTRRDVRQASLRKRAPQYEQRIRMLKTLVVSW